MTKQLNWKFQDDRIWCFSSWRVKCFVGANNSGKSSVLQAIQFAVGAAQTANKYTRNLDSEMISFTSSRSSFFIHLLKTLKR